MLLIGVVAASFCAVAFAVMAFFLEAQSRRMSERFTTLVPADEADDFPHDLKASMRERILKPLLERLNELAKAMTPAQSVKEITLRLERAGRPWGMGPHTWTLFRLAFIAGAALLGLMAARYLPSHGPLRMFALLGTAAMGIMGPSMWLDRKTKQRQLEIRTALPDVIDLLVVSVEAGMGLDGAVKEVISRRKGPLLDEFARVLAEIRVGRSRRSAWQDMALRTDVLEVKVFVAALVQAEELGASVAGVLRGQSEALRMRRSLMVREVAAALPIKMLFPLIFFIFPGIFIVILGPGMINIITTFKDIGF